MSEIDPPTLTTIELYIQTFHRILNELRAVNAAVDDAYLIGIADARAAALVRES